MKKQLKRFLSNLKKLKGDYPDSEMQLAKTYKKKKRNKTL